MKKCAIIWMLAFMAMACGSPHENLTSTTQSLGISDDEILVGSSLALGGHAGYLGTQTLHGALAYIQHVNQRGGIHGRTIKVIAYDDGYDPPRCVTNTQKLIVQDKVFALFCYVDTPTTVKILPLVEEARIPVVGMFTGANARDAINLKEEAGLGNNRRNIVIRSYTEADQVVVAVSDTGIGIDPAVKTQIFEAFFTTKKMGEGMGLGLSITSGIVEDYGGRIHIHSEEGQGTTFHLSFPAVP